MANYQDSDYALNKYSEGIVYRFSDGSTLTVTLGDYLAENQDKTNADFQALKEASDDIYYWQDRDESSRSKKSLSFDGLEETALRCSPSPEETMIAAIDAVEEAVRRRERLLVAKNALDKLTEVQRRRYLLCVVDGLTTREIAAMEGVGHTKIQKSLDAAEKKIKKFLVTA